MACEVINADASAVHDVAKRLKHPVVVTDPPFNIGYHYDRYSDNMPQEKYLEWLSSILTDYDCAVVHYPEQLHCLSIEMRRVPTRVLSWVYPSNTARQHRDIAFYGVVPDLNRVKQPYKNPNDKRIKELVKRTGGARSYDWFEVNQVKNVSKEKTDHPCQMPVEVMRRVVGVLPDGVTVIDPFCGSGTTGVACKMLGVDFVGIDISEAYCDIARRRIADTEAGAACPA